MSPAEHPMPPRLYVRILDLILNLLTHMDVREGVGQKREQLTMSMSTSFAVMPLFLNRSSRQLNMTSSASSLEVSMFRVGGLARIPGGKYVDSPCEGTIGRVG